MTNSPVFAKLTRFRTTEAWTLTAADVALCWTEARALQNKARKWAMEAADDIYKAFPVPIKGFDSDSGGEFINQYFKKYCGERQINFTRGRARHSNDNCFVEQKNGDVIRKTVGYFRYEGDEAFEALKKAYSYLNPLINYFYPTKKTIGKKTLTNGKVKKIFEKQLKTPYERVLEHPDVSDENKKRVMRIRAALDIVALHEKLEKACRELFCIATKKAGPGFNVRLLMLHG
jgi:hypothetical protein